MLKTVMAYLDNLIAWGDSLFRQDTGESIDEATQLYVLAAQLLGPAAAARAAQSGRPRKTYASLRADLDAISNAIRTIEADMLVRATPAPVRDLRRARSGRLGSIGADAATSACRATTSCSATGTRSPTGCSRSATA